MKILKVYSVFVLLINFSYAQTWSALGSGLSGTVPNEVDDIVIYNGKIYAGGYFSTAGGVEVNNISRWDGAQWDSVGSGFINDYLFVMQVYKNELYVGGDSPWSEGIVKWNDTDWISVGGGVQGWPSNAVHAMTIYNGDLYVGGEFMGAGWNPAWLIAKWDGTQWDSVGVGITYGYQVNDMAVYNNELYVAGDFDSIANMKARSIAKWNGSQWQKVNSGVGTNSSGRIWSLQVYNNELYVGGQFNSIDGLPIKNLAKWDGVKWDSVGNNKIGNNFTNIISMAVYNGSLYIGGEINIIENIPVNNIARWNGVQWDSLASGTNNGVWALATDSMNNILYVGGGFTSAGNISVNNIAQWSTPSAVFENIVEPPVILFLYPNPCKNTVIIKISSMIPNPTFYFTLSDMVGNQIQEVSIINTTTTISIEMLASGVYLYHLTDKNNRLLSAGKLIKNN